MLEKDIPWGRFDTLLGSIVTVVVAVFIVIVTGTVLPGIDIDSASQAAAELMKTDRYVGASWPLACLMPACWGQSASRSRVPGPSAQISAGTLAQYQDPPGAMVYATYFLMLVSSGLVGSDSARTAGSHHPVLQVIAVTLLPAALVFLILLLNDRTAVGEYCNTACRTWLAAASSY